MAVGDTYQVRVVIAFGVQTAINVLHYRTTAEAGIGATPLQIAQTIDGTLAPLYKALLTNAATYHGVGVKRIVGGLTLESATTANQGIGTAGANPLPLQVSGLVSLRTDFPGKAFRGRVYVPFPSVTDQAAGGSPTGGYLTRLAALATGIKTIFNAGVGPNTSSLRCVVYHRSSGGSDIVTNTPTLQLWATQRRRGDWGRANPAPF